MSDAEQPDFNPDPSVEECTARPTEVERPAAVREANSPSECEWNISEELQEAMQPDMEVMVPSPVDGLPIPAAERSSLNLALPVAFTYETMVCVGDDREFVELFKEEFWSQSPPAGVRSTPTAPDDRTFVEARERYDERGEERARRRWPRSGVIYRWGLPFVQHDGTCRVEGVLIEVAGYLIPVRPVRPKCIHYGRQLFSWDDATPENRKEGKHDKIRFTNCAHPARRSVGGAALSLRDEGVYACDWRSPPDPSSTEKWFDSVDRERLDRKGPVEMTPLFKIEGK